ncbi:FAD binding domain of DNA photolyase-domain-containing protein [Phyllosticta capitalensis]
MSKQKVGPRVIYWHRTDLRLHDSPALKAALDLKPECLWQCWTWDSHYVYRARNGPNRWQYLLDCQKDLSESITKINSKSKLFVIREGPQTLFPKLFKAWKVSHLVFEKDTDVYARDRDESVVKLAEDAGVKVIVKIGRTLYDPDELVKGNGGKPTMSISQVQAVAKKLGEPPRPIPAPKSLPDPGDTPLDFDHEKPSADPDLNKQMREGMERSFSALSGPNGDFAVPSMEELGLPAATTPHRGGESLALKRLALVCKDKEYTATFEKPKCAPTDFDPAATTLLSAHLHFGSLGIREFYWRVQDVVDEWKKGKHKVQATQPPTSLIGQLLFREMYFGAQAALGHSFHQTHNNPQCRFIPWHLPSKIDPKTKLATGDYTVNSRTAEQQFQRWAHGLTGFPWIDALMRQLRSEGWIEHLGRHAVACFLTRGGCYISWERGADVFSELLIDHEAACNAGNWQWLSCTAFFAQFFRCYSPVAFPKKWDKKGEFVRKYVPELAKYSDKCIYEPWTASAADQRKWGCVIRGDGEEKEDGKLKVYPEPMLDFGERRDACLKGMKESYGVGLYGNDKRVMDGTWRKLFPDDAEGVAEEHDAQSDSGDEVKSSPKPKGAAGKRRQAGQGTLDGVVKKAKK